jgi:hypothetical protein
MNFTDKLLRWYQRYFNEITWFVIGTISTQLVYALQRRDYLDALWCVIIGYVNFVFWKRNK